MNKRMVLSAVGVVLMIEAALMILPAVVSLIYGDSSVWAFVISGVITAAVGGAAKLFAKPHTPVIYAKEGFVIVALTWLSLSAFGALPYVISGQIPNYIDAFFEVVSGFTTTGSSIVPDVTALDHGILFWRSFAHWVGGMGILVFVMAVLPSVSERPIHILRAEMPGPIIGKLLPKARDTAVILYLIYIVLTIVEIVMLFLGGMSLFESSVLTFGTAGTGGLAILPDGISSYSPYCQWVIAIFMLIFGINFNLYFLILIGKLKFAIKSSELWVYFGIVASAIALISANINHLYSSFAETVRHSTFQVASIISTTGYATTDFNLWPTLSKTVITLLMFCGACAGSTAGGLKVSRVMMLFKIVGKEIRHLLHPRSVDTVRLEGKSVEEETVKNVSSYFIIYFICFFAVFLLLSFDPANYSVETNFSAVNACFNNIGPGFNEIGPMGNFDGYSYFSKIVLSFAMLLGRLEIFPMIVLFAPAAWRRNK